MSYTTGEKPGKETYFNNEAQLEQEVDLIAN